MAKILARACAGLLLLVFAASASAEVCDIRKEILALAVSVNRYSSTGMAAMLKRLPLADAERAKTDFHAQLLRLGYLCRAEMKNEQSPERAIMVLAIKEAGGMSILLSGGSLDDALVKVGQEAGVKLLEVAGRYFDAKPR